MDLQQAKVLLNPRLARPGHALREVIASNGYAAAPGCHDGMSAQLVCKTNRDLLAAGGRPYYNTVYGSGWGASAMLRFLPDRGFHDRAEISRVAANLVEGAQGLPVVMDAETGFGPGIAIPLLVRAYHDAGIAMMHVEDQPADGRACGHTAKDVCAWETMENRLKLAIVAREAIGSDMLIMGRTDAWDASNGSKEEAIKRGKAMLDLRVPGCDGKVDFIWSEYSTPDPGLAREFAQEMRRHDPSVMLGFNFSPNMDQPEYFRKHGITPATLEMYAEMGYKFMFHTVWSAKVQMQAMYDRTMDLQRRGPAALYDFQDQLYRHPVTGKHPTASGQAMCRTGEFQQLELFLGGEGIQNRLDKSKGFSIGKGNVSDVGSADNHGAK